MSAAISKITYIGGEQWSSPGGLVLPGKPES
jgi:hypothetical protein